MTYPDPKRVRTKRHTVCLDDYEDALVQALANYKGEQLGTLLRDLAIKEAREFLGSMHEPSLDQRTA
ncbi:hypothetical protein SAMN05518800_1805 [Variovorax sp. YR752]|uniref:hypothetical protein n=1 Tax=Variovorax sp. YR752 TaxID=1884383 RepID=UPI000BD7AA3B|nr:hypothetical protein [Variovorax sp. YR752]SOD25231.1 hypothetical protein SAMN05518800_1805 [Variovorax sp. YR752]